MGRSLGPLWGLQSPKPFSHLTNGSGDEGVKSQSEAVLLSPSFFFMYTHTHVIILYTFNSGTNRLLNTHLSSHTKEM